MLKPWIAQFACERPHCFLFEPVSLRTLADSYFVHCENDIRLCWVVRRSQDFSALSACVYSTLLFCCRYYIGDPKDQHRWLLLMYCSSQKPDIFDGFFKGSLGRKTYFPWKNLECPNLVTSGQVWRLKKGLWRRALLCWFDSTELLDFFESAREENAGFDFADKMVVSWL